MKTQVLMTLTAVAVSLLMMGSASVYGQVSEPDVEANIPFKFMVGDTSLPAGKYTIKRVDDQDPSTLEIRSADDSIAVAFLTESSQANRIPTKSELVFDRYGNQYFLSQIWTEGRDIEHRLTDLTDQNRGHLRAWLPWVDASRTLEDRKNFIRDALKQFAQNKGFVAGIWHEGKSSSIQTSNQTPNRDSVWETWN